MLQQIIKDMYIDPELLAELDDEQKQVLFCKLREEQVRRWKEREGKLEEEEKKRQKKSKPLKPAKNGKHQVGWLLGSDQKVWCWVMGDHPKDLSIDDILEEEAQEKAKSLAELEADDLARQKEMEMEAEHLRLEDETKCHHEELRKKAEQERLEDERQKREEQQQQQQQQQMKLLRVRHELKRRKSTEEINQLKEKRSSELYMSFKESRQNIEKLAEEDSKVMESEWREQHPKPKDSSLPLEKKSKAAQEEIRGIARRAREDHRRSLTDTLRTQAKVISKIPPGSENIRGQKPPVPTKPVEIVGHHAFAYIGHLPTLAEPPSLKDKIGRPPKPGSRRAIVDWFKEIEYPKGTGRDPLSKQIEPWFHGIITRHEAEELLESESCGTFLVRVSERIWGYAVSYRGPIRCKHFLIDTVGGHYQFFGTYQIAHAKLEDLVTFHKVTPISNSGQEKLITPCRQKQEPPNYHDLIPAFNLITL